MKLKLKATLREVTHTHTHAFTYISDCIILGTLPSNSAAESMKGFGLSVTDPTHPILLTQWKDEPLELPPKEPPLPTLEVNNTIIIMIIIIIIYRLHIILV